MKPLSLPFLLLALCLFSATVTAQQAEAIKPEKINPSPPQEPAVKGLTSELPDISELAKKAQEASAAALGKGAQDPLAGNGLIPLPRVNLAAPGGDLPSPASWAQDSRHRLAQIEFSFASRREQVIVELYPQDAPKTVEAFERHLKGGDYEGTAIHRVISGFLIQMGDPLTRDPKQRSRWGTGGEEQTLPAEIKRPHRRGALAMARRSDRVNPAKRSNGSQFFIALGKYAALDGQYTVFGQIVSGMEIIEKIAKMPTDSNDCPLGRIEIKACRVFDHVGPLSPASADGRKIFAGRPEAGSAMGRFFQKLW